jgi:hypothetical protein
MDSPPPTSLVNGADDKDIESAPNTAENPVVNSNRQQPIPPPSEPMQYRAIGLVEGQYHPSEERFNRGTLTTQDGTELNAVLLGQVMSLIKKYVDLDQNYLWVVYPRTREKEEMLHLQIVGVWSAGGFGPIAEFVDPEAVPCPLSPPLQDGYFSVRGQIVYQSEEKKTLFVKIQQAARKSKERPKDFKLKLNGVLEQKAIGYFWDLQVQRNGTELEVVEGTSIAAMPVKKRPPQGGKRRPPGGGGAVSHNVPVSLSALSAVSRDLIKDLSPSPSQFGKQLTAIHSRLQKQSESPLSVCLSRLSPLGIYKIVPFPAERPETSSLLGNAKYWLARLRQCDALGGWVAIVPALSTELALRLILVKPLPLVPGPPY